MEREAFEFLVTGERDHWWFRFRRELLKSTLERLDLPKQATILDAGCGSGGMLELLSRHGNVFGFEYDDEARQVAIARGIGPVEAGALPDNVPFGDRRFDMIGLFDVLEHLEHPEASMRALRDRLKDNGVLLVTVPAYQWLWGPHDEVCQHYRRYSRRSLRAHLASAGLALEYVSSYNLMVLPIAIAQRMRERVFGYSPAALHPSPLANKAFWAMCRQELRWLPQRTLPAGLSLLAVARRVG